VRGRSGKEGGQTPLRRKEGGESCGRRQREGRKEQKNTYERKFADEENKEAKETYRGVGRTMKKGASKNPGSTVGEENAREHSLSRAKVNSGGKRRVVRKKTLHQKRKEKEI